MEPTEDDRFTPDDADALSPEFFEARKRDLAGRVGKRRFAHSEGVSDTIEPHRDFAGVQQIRDAVGKVCLEDLFLMTMGEVLDSLVRRRDRIHPGSVNVWKQYVTRAKSPGAY